MSTEIGRLPKNARDKIVVSISEYKGHQFLDVRTFVEDYHDGNNTVATKKGIALKLGKLPELIALLQRAEQQARADGLL